MDDVIKAVILYVDRTEDTAAARYMRISQGIAWLILSGRVGAGVRLPGVERLHAETGMTVETFSRAYAILVERQLVEIRKGSGTYVRSLPNQRAALQEHLTDEFARMVDTARLVGIDDELMMQCCEAALQQGKDERVRATA